MPTLLSTKKLSPAQSSLILHAGFGLVHYNAIKVDSMDFQWDRPNRNLIFTSQNAITSVLNYITPEQLSGFKIFCVGEKTAQVLREFGCDISEMASYGKDLAEKIVARHSQQEFTYFCGNLRNDTLPDALQRNKVQFEEIKVYTTTLKKKTFGQEFDGILFFSPSGVRSFCSSNSIKDSICFCIGTTTALEVKNFSNNIVTATIPSIENVIVQAVGYLNKQVGTGNPQ